MTRILADLTLSFPPEGEPIVWLCAGFGCLALAFWGGG